jgi:hypothetical protein
MLRPPACSRACAAPDGMCHGAPESPLAAHAGGTGAARPVRGGGAGPAHMPPLRGLDGGKSERAVGSVWPLRCAHGR